MTYITSITKGEMAQMPLENYSGKIVVIEREQDVEQAVKSIYDAGKVGFDTETRPNFQKGQFHKIALMQIATEDACFLFRLNVIGMPESLKSVLADPSILKIGLSLRDDFGAIRRRTSSELKSFLDLQGYVGKFGITDASLQKIYAILFNKRISKGQRLTNWEAEQLTETQQRYAALDAWACLVIYNHLNFEKK